MAKPRKLPCHHRLDSALEQYFCPEGASIKSILAMTARGTTEPTALRRQDVSAETLSWLVGLTEDEINAVRAYYHARACSDVLARRAGEARRELRSKGRRRAFKTGIAEAERKWNERKPR